jgi:uncharacterized membrane protein YfcA
LQLFGYIACLLIGVSLGSIGAGGGILTVPVMVYLFHVPVVLATSYSLFIVGLTSLIGAASNYRQSNTNIKVAGLFCLVSAGIVLVIRSWLLPLIPSRLFIVGGAAVTWSLASMLLFAVLLFVSASVMIRRREEVVAVEGHLNIFHLVGSGIIVGGVTGLLGAGGGFILIPSMVLLLKFPVKEAIGTSLLIIAVNSLLGFGMDLRHMPVDWHFLGWVTAVALLGIILGIAIASRVGGDRLRIIFGWFMVGIGVIVLVKELVGFFSIFGA